MIKVRKEATAVLTGALSERLDDFLATEGFRRRKNSLKYSRSVLRAKQYIELAFQFRPTYEPDAVAHILPVLTVKIPEVNAIAIEMVAGDSWLLANAPELTIRQPIDMAAPKEHHTRWFFSDENSGRDAVCAIREFIACWGLPFLNDFTSPESITTALENDDSRLLKQQHWYIYAAAAYLAEGKRDAARDLLSAKFDSPGLKEKFHRAFEIVERV